jgi:hypothetical protein
MKRPSSVMTEKDYIWVEKYFWSCVHEEDTTKCWFYRNKNLSYYPRIEINGRSHTMHRIVYELFYGDIPDGKLILHACDKRSCINPVHLRAGTPRDNAIDQRFNKTPLMFDEKNIKVVRYMRTLDYKYADIASFFNCGINTIYDIVNYNRSYTKEINNYNPII